MAQSGFMLSDEGRTISVVNTSGTTAITAGDIVYSDANDDVLGGTAAAARNQWDGEADISVRGITQSATGYQTALGVALEDIPASGYGSIALEGVFIHAVAENVEAGNPVQGEEAATNRVQVADQFDHKIGKALTGGSAAGKFIVWKLAL